MSLYSGRELNCNRVTPNIRSSSPNDGRIPDALTFGDRNNNTVDDNDSSLNDYDNDASVPVDPRFVFPDDEDDTNSEHGASIVTASSNNTAADAFYVVTVGANEEVDEFSGDGDDDDVDNDDEDDVETVGANATIGADANVDTATGTDTPNASNERGRGFRTINKINYSDMHTAKHLKTVG